MPIFDVLWVGDEAPPPLPPLADALGAALGLPAGRCWVRLQQLPRAQYAENGVVAADTPQPVFVEVLHARWPANLAEELARLSRCVADWAVRPLDCVHLRYAPPGAGRVGFGGALLR